MQSLILDSKLKYKSSFNSVDLYTKLFSNDFYSIEYDIYFQQEIFHQMSDGKKAFVILQMLLDYSNNTCPILIDQPEDDLDNNSIYTDLVKYIKEKKLNRQIIIITHNANLVVSTDAEQIIVAKQKKNFSYITGALEKKEIKEYVCNILEGGKQAFQLRDKKYNF